MIINNRKASRNNAGFIKRTINNYLGYWPQELGLIKPYKWRIEYTFGYYYD